MCSLQSPVSLFLACFSRSCHGTRPKLNPQQGDDRNGFPAPFDLTTPDIMTHTTQDELTAFSSMLATLVAVDDHYAITLPADWLQGRTAYGGLSASLCLQATLLAHPDLPPLRSAQFSFIGPASGALRIRPQLLRQGKSAAFIGVDLEGDAGLAVRATLCFGAGRDLPHDYSLHAMPDTPALASCPSFFTWAQRPNFMAHFEGRLAGGHLPGSGSDHPEMLVWLRHRDTATQADVVSLVALADALPPISFATFTDAVPISTMTWSIDLLTPKIDNPEGWWLIRGEAETIREGYSAQTAVIWHPDGRPVMSARQQVAIFARR